MAVAENAVPPTSCVWVTTPGMSTPIEATDLVPAGMAFGALPLGLAFFARPGSEALLLGMAFAFEQLVNARRAPRYVPTLEFA